MNRNVTIWQAIPWFVLGWICCEIVHLVIR
jgi:hypothetical protein